MAGKPTLWQNAPLQFLDLGAIPREQLQEGGLSARHALHAAHGRGADDVIQILEVQQQVLDPERGPLAHGGGLGGLEVREPERGLVLPLGREGRQGRDHVLQAAAQQGQRLLHDEQVAVVGDETAGGPQVDDGARAWRLFAPGIDRRHHVMPQGGFMFRNDVEVHRVLGGPQFGELSLGHGQPKFRLGFGQGDPEPPPHPLAVERRQQAHHGLAGVAAGQGMLESLQFGTVVGRKEGHKNSGPPVSHTP
jgi:hypothetical protein